MRPLRPKILRKSGELGASRSSPARTGSLTGIEAVIDKDLASALHARQLGVEILLLPNDVGAVYLDFGKPAALPIAPTGSLAAIGQLDDAASILRGHAGTRIEAGVSAIAIRSRTGSALVER